jgi:hypothetical protein
MKNELFTFLPAVATPLDEGLHPESHWPMSTTDPSQQ